MTNSSNFNFPSSGYEVGSIIDQCKKYLDADKHGKEDIAFRVCRKPKVCINIISVLKERCGETIALRFAEEVIKQTAYAYSR
jgi:hypothetical protein